MALFRRAQELQATLRELDPQYIHPSYWEALQNLASMTADLAKAIDEVRDAEEPAADSD